MKVLMFSTDAKVLEDGTDARARMIEYGALFEELHIIVLSERKLKTESEKVKVNEGVFIYNTNSRWKILRLWDAYKIGRYVATTYNLQPTTSVISVQDPFETGLVGYWLKKKFGLPLQVQVHTDFLNPNFFGESLKNKIRVWLGKRLLKNADGVRVVSERIKKSILAARLLGAETPIDVLPIFVDVKRLRHAYRQPACPVGRAGAAPTALDLKKKYPQFSFIILMASRLTTEKHVGLAISAMREVVKKYPHAGLVIVGEGPGCEALQLLSTHYSLQTNVVFEPWTNDLASYYKSADIFLITSNYEGYGRTAVEAAACGVPVVMTDVGLAGELIVQGFNGIVVPVGDEAGIAGGIVALLDRPAMREEFARHSGELTLQLPSRQQYLARYRELLAGLVSRA